MSRAHAFWFVEMRAWRRWRVRSRVLTDYACGWIGAPTSSNMNIEFDRSIKVQTTDDPPLSPAATPAPGPDPTLDGVTVKP